MKTLALTGMAAFTLNKINQQIERKSKEWNPTHFDELYFYPWHAGHIAYHVKGKGKPLLLVHGVGAGSSSYEWRKNIDELSNHYQVYSIDLLGFGLSDKPKISYSAQIYVDLLADFIRDVIKRPTSILASGISAGFVIQLAAQDASSLEQMILICPSGLELEEEHQQKNEVYAAFLKNLALQVPILNQSLYYLISSKINIRQFLKEFIYHHQENLTEDIVEQYYLAAHRGGNYAGEATQAFLRGKLDVPIQSEWSELTMPTLILWGRHAKLLPVHYANRFKHLNPRTEFHIFESSGLLPHDEEANLFHSICLSFLQKNSNQSLYLQ